LDGRAEEIRQVAQRKIEELETRNKTLAKMLDDALQALRSTKLASSESPGDADQSFNMSLAKIQFVSVYLANNDIPIPPEIPISMPKEEKTLAIVTKEASVTQADTSRSEPATSSTQPSAHGVENVTTEERKKEAPQAAPSPQPVSAGEGGGSSAGHKSRPSLMDSSFSFMLGENRHRSSFVTSVAALPEQRRDSESKTRSAQLSNEAKTQQARRDSESEDDGFTLTKMRGG